MSTICTVSIYEFYFNLEIMIMWKYWFASLEPFKRNEANNDDITNISKLINQTQAETADDILLKLFNHVNIDCFSTLILAFDFRIQC